MTTQTTIDLTKFVDPNRVYLAEPFSRGAYSYATDGHILVRVPRIATIADGIGPTGKSLDDLVAVLDKPLPQLDPLPAVSEPNFPHRDCKSCGGSGRVMKCKRCHGAGEIECCECGNDQECPSCKGHGEKPCTASEAGGEDCEDCGGAGRIVDATRYTAIEIAPGLFLRHDILARVAALPCARIERGDGGGQRTGRPVVIEFDGGTGLAMPCHPYQGEQTKRLADVAQPVAAEATS